VLTCKKSSINILLAPAEPGRKHFCKIHFFNPANRFMVEIYFKVVIYIIEGAQLNVPPSLLLRQDRKLSSGKPWRKKDFFLIIFFQ